MPSGQLKLTTISIKYQKTRADLVDVFFLNWAYLNNLAKSCDVKELRGKSDSWATANR